MTTSQLTLAGATVIAVAFGLVVTRQKLCIEPRRSESVPSEPLPSPNYISGPPIYIPPSPSYPLPRELKSLVDAAAAEQLNK